MGGCWKQRGVSRDDNQKRSDNSDDAIGLGQGIDRYCGGIS
ncbi:MAG: hypothetical protein VW124_09325 [Paracoccaceae bacterium]